MTDLPPLVPCLNEGGYDIRILADGTWIHEGRPIRRMQLVKLFSTVLSRDEDGLFWLRTPAEAGVINVDDAPFVAVELFREGYGKSQTLTLRTNIDDYVEVGSEHPLWCIMQADKTPRPYVRVRGRLDALISRSVFYELVAIAEEQDGMFGIYSHGSFFPLGASSE